MRIMAILLLGAAEPLAAQEVSASYRAELWTGLETQGGEAALSRLTLEPTLEFTGVDVTGEFVARLEVAPDATGLGRRDGFSPASRPIGLGDDAQIEIDRVSLQWRVAGARLTIGKQVMAWGVLDGVQVTDRFDPVRRRDFVFTEYRPERIARWGARARGRLGGVALDLAFVPDPTVAQLARPGDRFDPPATRLRGGLPLVDGAPDTVFSARNRWWADASYGGRASARLGRLAVTALAFSAPEPDPLVALGPAGPELVSPRRTLVGGTATLSAGAVVLRMEAAHVPDQPVNFAPLPVGGGLVPQVGQRPRTLLGAGMDWSAPAGIFVNAQAVVDHIKADARGLVRPETEVIATLRAQKTLARDTVKLSAEWLVSVREGDGAVRPAVEWQLSDSLAATFGADLMHGDTEGLFGQFRDRSRVWLRLRVTG
ncbi:MAG: hypothetical protein ACMVO5_11810 [Polymorphobacter sp.]|uniref:hypothetical protein n=1 Tax=Polymorphobacter sp. TaxID=1909290 RepID=UPI003A8B707E